MRITQVNLQPDFGGAERHTLLLADGLRARGHQVTLICHPNGRLKSQADERGLDVEAVTAKSQLDLRAAFHLATQFRKLRPELVHLQTSKEYITGLIAARLSRVPVVVASRHLLLSVKPTMRVLFRNLDGVVVLSRGVRDNLVRHGVPGAKIHVIYAGIDTKEFAGATEEKRLEARHALGVPATRLLIGMAGRMVEGKGHRDLLDAVALLARKDVPVTLALVGEGPLLAELESRARNLGIADQVVFAGFYPDLAAFMRALDVFVMASTVEEVMPLVIMEAMAAGCPVVATRVGGVPEILDADRNGLLAAPGDSGALADALFRLADAPSLRSQLSKAGLDDVRQRFTVGRMVADTEQLYERLRADAAVFR